MIGSKSCCDSLNDDTRWGAFESALNQHTVRVYDLPTERVHVDSTSASAYTSVTEEGLFQFGHSKDHRPDLPQVKVMQAVLDPLGMPLATDVVSGERADDPLYIPCIERVQASLGRQGLLYVGDCKMAARETRAFIAAKAIITCVHCRRCNWPKTNWTRPWRRSGVATHALSPVLREREDGEPELIAQGYERQVPMRSTVAGSPSVDRAALGGPLGAPGAGGRGGPARPGGQSQGGRRGVEPSRPRPQTL